MKKRLLIVVDAQNDFITGSLGSEDAQKTVPFIVYKIDTWDGDIIATYDTHNKDYLNTFEGKHLPVEHCIFGTWGHRIQEDIMNALQKHEHPHLRFILKNTFGSLDLAGMVAEGEYDEIEIIGYDTDVCVISNVLILRATVPETPIFVDRHCCCGITPELHESALNVMKSCQIEIKDGENV